MLVKYAPLSSKASSRNKLEGLIARECYKAIACADDRRSGLAFASCHASLCLLPNPSAKAEQCNALGIAQRISSFSNLGLG
jgi:hypothetical protein